MRALRAAIEANAVDGWARLDEARQWLAQHDPDQIPNRYGCHTWPQVLSESRCFQLEYRPGPTGKVAWFRAKA